MARSARDAPRWLSRPRAVGWHVAARPLTIGRVRNDRAVTGHVHLRRGKRGNVFYLRCRLPSGEQVQRRLGPEWTERGRPPAGHYTRRMADAALRETLVDVGRSALTHKRTGVTFEQAVNEWLHYVEYEKQRT